MYAVERGEPLPRGDLRVRRQGGHVLQGLLVRRDDRVDRRAREEDGHQALLEPTASAGSRPTTSSVAIRDEYKENEDLPNTTNPDDWARISGKKGERIVFVRTLMGEGREHRPVETITPGQYL